MIGPCMPSMRPNWFSSPFCGLPSMIQPRVWNSGGTNRFTAMSGVSRRRPGTLVFAAIQANRPPPATEIVPHTTTSSSELPIVFQVSGSWNAATSPSIVKGKSSDGRPSRKAPIAIIETG